MNKNNIQSPKTLQRRCTQIPRHYEALLFQILAIPRLGCLGLSLLLIPALTLHLNKNTMWNLEHDAFRLNRALQLGVLLYNKTV